MMYGAVALLAFVLGFLTALKAVGYGVRYGLQQCVRLWRYRTGRCQCVFCKPQDYDEAHRMSRIENGE